MNDLNQWVIISINCSARKRIGRIIKIDETDVEDGTKLEPGQVLGAVTLTMNPVFDFLLIDQMGAVGSGPEARPALQRSHALVATNLDSAPASSHLFLGAGIELEFFSEKTPDDHKKYLEMLQGIKDRTNEVRAQESGLVLPSHGRRG